MGGYLRRQRADPGHGPVAHSHPMLRAGKRCQKSVLQTGPQWVLWWGFSSAGHSGQLPKSYFYVSVAIAMLQVLKIALYIPIIS